MVVSRRSILCHSLKRKFGLNYQGGRAFNGLLMRASASARASRKTRSLSRQHDNCYPRRRCRRRRLLIRSIIACSVLRGFSKTRGKNYACKWLSASWRGVPTLDSRARREESRLGFRIRVIFPFCLRCRLMLMLHVRQCVDMQNSNFVHTALPWLFLSLFFSFLRKPQCHCRRIRR